MLLLTPSFRQNHNPQVIIVDEIGTTQEADSARTIAQRGTVAAAVNTNSVGFKVYSNDRIRRLLGGDRARSEPEQPPQEPHPRQAGRRSSSRCRLRC